MGTPGSRLPPITMQYVYTVENHIVFMLQASDLAPLFSVYPRRWSLPQVISRHGFWHVARQQQTTLKTAKHTGGALTVTKGLVGKWKGWRGNSPALCIVKKCPGYSLTVLCVWIFLYRRMRHWTKLLILCENGNKRCLRDFEFCGRPPWTINVDV